MKKFFNAVLLASTFVAAPAMASAIITNGTIGLGAAGATIGAANI